MTVTAIQFLYSVFPYVAIAIGVIGAIWRYIRDRFSYSSLSSQFLESRQLFWGSVGWHYGVLILLLGHLIGFLIPREVAAWNGVPWRLYVLEGAALAFGLLTLWGLIVLVYRRLAHPRIRAVTSFMDGVLLLVLLLQVIAGIWTAIAFRWGSSWYASAAVPYLWSVLRFSPRVDLVANLPWPVHTHILGAFLLVSLTPFTRLAHALSFPYSYLWRPYQVVIWNRRKASHG
jgi:nitrate reductase gamma subunit